MALKTAPHHYYIVTAMITYVRDDQPKQRHMNAIMELPRKVIPTSGINNVRMGMLQRLTQETGVPADGVRDIVFLNFSYLGNMKPSDFYDMEAPRADVTKQ